MRLLAFPLTPLLLLLGVAEVLGGLPLPLRFSPVVTCSAFLVGIGEAPPEPFSAAPPGDSGEGDGDFVSVLGLEDAVVLGLLSAFGEEPDEPPNILLNSRPPCEERLRRLDPARLLKDGGD